MKITVIGTGAIGGNLARRLGAAGHDIQVAGARGPEFVPEDVLEFGARAVTTAVGVQDRDVIILSVPFHRVPELAGPLASVAEGTVVVDTSNYYPQLNGHIEAVADGQAESLWITERLGRPVVKAWNAALAETQLTRGVPAGTPGRIAVPVAGDSEDARRIAMRLVDDTGFDPFDAGVLADSWRQQPGTPAYCTELNLKQLESALAAADRTEAPRTRDRLMERFAALTSAPTLDEIVEINRSAHH
ncbi:NAD(P)-binding domain-containing protein [Streptomyces sp. NPDC006622]|uniref:NADPH-dependent F420 reductase n=1 Tax=Streptomyces sp. NPDC006622 TaxID=3155459 RepID=UPI0033AEEB07